MAGLYEDLCEIGLPGAVAERALAEVGEGALSLSPRCAWCLREQGMPLGSGSHGICARHAVEVRQERRRRQSHVHQWIRLPDAVSLFSCADGSCLVFAVCPGCLNSLDAALYLCKGIAGLVLYWCPEHASLEVHA